MELNSLFGEEFEIKVEQPKVTDLIKKVKSSKSSDVKDVTVTKALKSKKLSLQERLDIIKENVFKVLGKQKDNVLVIKTKDDFNDYITKAISAGVIAIDTETNNSLSPINCKIMGLCLYVPSEKQAYIPINHIDNSTGERLSWQCTEEDCREELQRIIDANVFCIFHNYKFDYEVIKCTCGIEVPCHWDTLIAAKLINENELSAGLKQLYIKYIDNSQEKYSIDHLFENVLYAQVDPEIFAMYAGTDSMMTYKLYLWQKPIMEEFEASNPDLNPYKLFRDVELPVIQVMAEMELNGIRFDIEYANRLRTKFENKLKLVDEKINIELATYKDKIEKWRLSVDANERNYKRGKEVQEVNGIIYSYYGPSKEGSCWHKKLKTGDVIISNEEATKLGFFDNDLFCKSKSEQLEDPIVLSSPTQLAILLYDILRVPVVDKETPRGTGEDILVALKDKYKLCEYLLERRSLEKMLNAFINSLPEEVNPKTGKIHCHFNQYGAATGRTSCSNPNLQQIPSHEKSIRLLFTADPGYVLVGSDFSQQEPRLLSFYSADPNLINAYKEGKDLYGTVASKVYKMDYWDCMEHHEDGSPNPEGKKRRASCKSIILGGPKKLLCPLM